MKKIICLLACLCCLLMVMGCEKLPGEETLPPARETTQPTRTTTAPTETTTPPETTVPTETTSPEETTAPEETTGAWEPQEIPCLQISDPVPAANTAGAEMVVYLPEVDPSGMVSAVHARFSTAMAEVKTYNDGVFRKCIDEQEMKSGSHYQAYAVVNGQLKALENRTFAKEISFLGGKTYLEFQYAVNGDEIALTYIPPLSISGLPNYTRVVDTSRGLKECFVYLTYFTERDGNLRLTQYFDLLNLETGELAGFLADFDPAVFDYANMWDFIAWTEEGDPVFSANGSYHLLDLSSKTVVENYPYPAISTYQTIFWSEKAYLEITDPLNGETVYLKVPECWDCSSSYWARSPDGRKLMQWEHNDILIYDGDRHMWILIDRTLPDSLSEIYCLWRANGDITTVSADFKSASVYRFAADG